jgi:hypothetical protein
MYLKYRYMGMSLATLTSQKAVSLKSSYKLNGVTKYLFSQLFTVVRFLG